LSFVLFIIYNITNNFFMIEGFRTGLFITQDSKIYGAYEDEIVFWGNNFYESLENVYFDNISWEIIKDFFHDK
ncbi:MAG: hypothetical protein K2J25_06615, partial [Oscillospiraceae bacterium]|nr:hypothetical protein [Oscillospiraceae bacterium]